MSEKIQKQIKNEFFLNIENIHKEHRKFSIESKVNNSKKESANSLSSYQLIQSIQSIQITQTF